MTEPSTHRQTIIRNGALGICLAATAVCAFVAFQSPADFWSAYLFGYIFWLGIPLGSLGIALLHLMTGGRWGEAIARELSAAIGTLPLSALLLLPLLLAPRGAYPWLSETGTATGFNDHQQQWMSYGFFAGRAALYFVVWLGFGFLASRYLTSSTAGKKAAGRGRLGAVGLILLGLTATFAAVDWVMSLEAEWYSTIYGVVMAMGFVVAALAAALLTRGLLADGGTESADRIQARHDLGNLLMAFLLVWVYVAFSQFLIIWSGDLPHEAAWYHRRLSGGWLWSALSLPVLHFAVPFALLLSRPLKQDRSKLAAVAALLLAMRVVDVHWTIAPAFGQRGGLSLPADAAAWAAVGGLWCFVFLLRREQSFRRINEASGQR